LKNNPKDDEKGIEEMAISIILAHPQKSSFNHAIAADIKRQLADNGYAVNFHDLYAEGFDPILNAAEIPEPADLPVDVKRHCEEISQTEGIVIIHPNWWGQPPAILKGWIDRVLRPGVAYQFLEGDKGEGIPVGLLKARVALVFNTSNTPKERELNVFGDPLENLWKNCIFNLCGVSRFHRRMFGVVITSSADDRQHWLDEVREIISAYFPRT
jgi:putative NADPH-quinone reductase